MQRHLKNLLDRITAAAAALFGAILVLTAAIGFATTQHPVGASAMLASDGSAALPQAAIRRIVVSIETVPALFVGVSILLLVVVVATLSSARHPSDPK